MLRVRLILTAVVGSLLFVLGPGAAGAGAATITPNTFADDDTDNGNCTLREAVIAANNNAAEDACPAGSGAADDIPLAAGTYTLSIAGAGESSAATGDLDLLVSDEAPEALTIHGVGARNTIVSQTVADRVFDVVDSDLSATITGLTVTGGSGVTQGGGIFANGPLTVTDVAVTGNTADSQGGTFGGQGGGIFSNGPLTLTGSTLSGNHALATGADFPGQGGGLFVNDTPTNVTNVTVSDNDTSAGVVFPGQGGGIFLNDVTTLAGVTVSHNQAAPTGDGQGGGIFINDQLTARGVLVSNNLIGATPSECFVNDDVISEGGNLERGTDCEFTHPSDQSGVDPQLGPLQNNGGPTDTRALPTGSPAVDAWPTESGCPGTDQRGVARPQFAACDSGAFELAPPEAPPYDQTACPFPVDGKIEQGGAGDDTILGTELTDLLLGGAGNDTIGGLGDRDCLFGEDGNDKVNGDGGGDRVKGGKNDDRVKGNDGKDHVRGSLGNDKSRGNDGNDTVSGNGNADNVKGGAGNDTVNGQRHRDKVFGNSGKDKVRGGPAKDKLSGGGGNDTLKSVDQFRDKVNCGGGDDKATVDDKDKVSGNCEQVTVK